jgi:hypothetical protein
MPLTRWDRVYVVRRWCDRFSLHFEWAGLPCGFGSLVGTLMGMWLMPVDHWNWFGLVQGLLSAGWMAIGLWRPMHRRFGFSRYTRFRGP